MENNQKLTVSSSPHIRARTDTRSIMADVIISLMPALVVAIWVFGFSSLAVVLVSVVFCVFFEWGYRKIMKKPGSIGDLSAAVTGILLAFVLPSGIPLWVPVIGAFFSIIIVKQLFGGIGKNFLNPALAGRAFLLSWPVFMTTWAAPRNYAGVMNADGVTAATPMAILNAAKIPDYSLADMFLGTIGGSLGEVSALALIIGGIYLVIRKVISLRIPLSYIITVAALTLIFPKGGNNAFEWMAYSVLGGGLMLGAIFMATDYSTSPITAKGQIIYGVGCGLLTVVIRYFGAYPEGVCFSIMIMNICVWLIDKATGPGQFGVSKEDLKAKKDKAKEEKKRKKEEAAV
ncbi:MAG: RnfABCDGE type electron transport complex subunit D [Oscillospiraceae bacterium]|nr:RnfABCDGE type electron transport complex subunit D [Oscillospiraceae bacterium]